MRRYKPGDEIQAEIEFDYAQSITEVSMGFNPQQEIRRQSMPIQLHSGRLLLTANPQTGLSSTTVTLEGEVDQVHKAGRYDLARITFKTAGGQDLTLRGEDLDVIPEEERSLEVVPEDRTPPTLRGARLS
jgi:hypothetical protein